MSTLSDDELKMIATWYIGAPVPDELMEPVLEKLDPADEEQTLKLGKAVQAAVKRYRREHGKWPVYREWPARTTMTS